MKIASRDLSYQRCHIIVVRGDMIETYKIIAGIYDRDVTPGPFNLRIDSNTRGQLLKIFKERPRLDIRKRSVFFQVTDPRNSFPNQVAEATTVEAFDRRLDRHWRGYSQLYDFRAKK